jgi:two-component system sensor histidine kinase RegB
LLQEKGCGSTLRWADESTMSTATAALLQGPARATALPIEREPALWWIVRLRWGTVIAETATVLVASRLLAIPLETESLLAVIGVAAASNVALHLWLRAGRPLASFAIGGLLLAETGLLTTLLYLSGGPWNPFTSLYLVYVTLAALSLGMGWASAIVVAAAAGYAWLFHAHVPVCVLEHQHHGEPGLPTHLQTMWVAFVVTGMIVAYFVSRVAGALRERDTELARAQRTAARNEKIVSLSTLAAGAAHELGTPLATIAVAAHELERVLEREGVSSDDTRMIKSAVERCRRIVLQMSGRSAEGLGEVPQSTSIESLLGELRARAVLGGPDRLAVEVDSKVPAAVAVPREGLLQALVSVVRNAIDASGPEGPVVLRVLAEPGRLRFDVEDRGSGIAADILARLGEPFFTTKPAGRGMGLGVFLARAFAERWSGSMAIDSAPGQGTTVTLIIPAAVEA